LIQKFGFFLLFHIFLESCMFRSFGGAFHPDPSFSNLSKEAKALVAEAYKGINVEKLVDFHTHIIGTGTSCKDCYINPNMKSIFHPAHFLRYKIYLSTLGVKSASRADEEALHRLINLIRSNPYHGKHYILAFDKHYNQDGTVNEEKTEFYVPNEYVYALSQQYPDIFLPAISVHPYRKDALEQIDYWAEKGVRLMKWLPNAQGMDPSDKNIIPFYKKLIEKRIVLLSHSGEEKAVEADEYQKLGNPLLFRLALQLGVHVILAHCASLGQNSDLDTKELRTIDNFVLFSRLMEEKFNGKLYGDISALSLVTRLPKPILTVLEKEDWAKKLVDGSDYPIPAVNVLIHLGKLEKLKLITKKERELLREIYQVNPLLFDFVLKRSLRHPSSGNRLKPEIFENKEGIFQY
ncbi:MAG: amidohydrolase family protein, partial [Leptospiraceae bacterium]|nr:amidohydrolase family protein [Leptospiraceae bacterium]